MRDFGFTPIAAQEFLDGFDWYERQVSGLGLRFRHMVYQAIYRIDLHPRAYPFVHGPIQKIRVDKFPYHLFFECTDDQIVIVAVFHMKKNPDRLRERIT